jgi:hypothetical protein
MAGTGDTAGMGDSGIGAGRAGSTCSTGGLTFFLAGISFSLIWISIEKEANLQEYNDFPAGWLQTVNSKKPANWRASRANRSEIRRPSLAS